MAVVKVVKLRDSRNLLTGYNKMGFKVRKKSSYAFVVGWQAYGDQAMLGRRKFSGPLLLETLRLFLLYQYTVVKMKDFQTLFKVPFCSKNFNFLIFEFRANFSTLFTNKISAANRFNKRGKFKVKLVNRS